MSTTPPSPNTKTRNKVVLAHLRRRPKWATRLTSIFVALRSTCLIRLVTFASSYPEPFDGIGRNLSGRHDLFKLQVLLFFYKICQRLDWGQEKESHDGPLIWQTSSDQKVSMIGSYLEAFLKFQYRSRIIVVFLNFAIAISSTFFSCNLLWFAM